MVREPSIIFTYRHLKPNSNLVTFCLSVTLTPFPFETGKKNFVCKACISTTNYKRDDKLHIIFRPYRARREIQSDN